VESLASKMFHLAGWILRSLTSRSDRALLVRRLTLKLTGARRGRLRLPDHFPEVVRRLSDMTNSQLRDTVHWVKPNDGVNYLLNKQVVNYIHQVMPGGYIRTVNTNPRVHVRQQAAVRPLPASDWPRLETRAAWPSSPTVVELLAMSRRGLTPLPLIKSATPAFHRISTAYFNSNVELRAKVISHQIVGIRSDIEVPRRFLGYFGYRWGFLILTSRYSLPAGLVRFLTGQWIRNPHNLWLREKYSFKRFLKKTDFRTFCSPIPGPW